MKLAGRSLLGTDKIDMVVPVAASLARPSPAPIDDGAEVEDDDAADATDDDEVDDDARDARTPSPAARSEARASAARTAQDARARVEARFASAPATSAPVWSFDPSSVDGTYDASDDVTDTYDIGAMRGDAPQMWSDFGETFQKVGAEMQVDPYALASYCAFESYNSETGTYNPRMLDRAGDMVAAGIGATQAQDWAGRQVPGKNLRFPDSVEATQRMLRDNPEVSIRCLASEMKRAYAEHGEDLARAFPHVAYPAWGPPSRSHGAYGDMAEYVSRAFALYQAFRAADA